MHVHLNALLRAAGAQRVVVSGRAQVPGGINDSEPGLGPLGGVASVISTLADGAVWLLVLAIDTPRLTPESLRLLEPTSDRDYRQFQAHPLPLGIRVNPRTRQSLAMCLQQTAASNRSLRAWLAMLQGEQLALNPALSWQLQGANTPEQWQALQ